MQARLGRQSKRLCTMYRLLVFELKRAGVFYLLQGQ